MPIRQEISARTAHAKGLFAPLPASYDRVGALLSLGRDPRWRRYLVSRVLVGTGDRTLDVATGTGAVAIEIMRRDPGVRVVGLDQSEDMIREGVRRVAAAGMGERMEFVLGRGQALPFPDRSFDAVTFTYLLRYVDDPRATVLELARVLRPGGSLASLEFHVPGGPWRAAWWLYTRAVIPAIGRAVSRGWYEAGRFLGPSISSFVAHHPIEEQLAWWRGAAIDDVASRTLTLGSAVVLWGTKRAD